MAHSSTEHERIRQLRERLERKRRDVRIGIGDDAAVLLPDTGSMVLTVDASVEGVHFRREWASWRDIGRRSYIAAASDLAAMGAKPRVALLALVLPQSVDDDALFALVDGVAEGADECGAPVVGGNLAAGGEVSITTTVVGEIDGEPLTRAGARPGDGVYVTGAVGVAALGLAALRAGREGSELATRFVARWRRPTARLVEGERLREIATAAIDVSDGLVQDLDHVCEASGVGAQIDLARLPLERGHAALAAELGVDPWIAALTGGEDYELLFAAPHGKAVAKLATRIGHFTPRAGEVEVLGENGDRIDLPSRGFDHFR